MDDLSDSMVRVVNTHFRITLQVLGTEAYFLSWSPADLPAGAELRVGIGKCTQPAADGRCPHPLKFRRVRTDRSGAVEHEACAHHSDLENDRYPGEYTLFDGEECGTRGEGFWGWGFPGLESRVSLTRWTSVNG